MTDDRKRISSVIARRAGNASSQRNLPEREVDFIELDDGSLVEVVEDPARPNQTALALFKGGRTRFTNLLEYKGQLLVPIPRTAVGFSEMKLPSGVLPYRSTTRLFYEIASLLKYGIDLVDYPLYVISAFVLYTWIADRLPIGMYLSIVGLPQSGKTTLLELLSLICRQPLLVSDVTPAAAYEACSRFSPTLLFGEVDWRSPKTPALRQLWRAGTTRASRALRVSGSVGSFGPKVFSSLEPSTDAALNSRCVQIQMGETTRRDLVKPGDPRMLKLADRIRKQLLNWRFKHYRCTQPVTLEGAEELRPRSRDLLSSLAASLGPNSLEASLLLEFFKYRHDPATRECLSPQQDALVFALTRIIHSFPNLPAVRIGGGPGSLEDTTNATLRDSGERQTVTDRGVGAMLSSMGCQAKRRTNQGWFLLLDSGTRERAHQLIKTHGNRYVAEADLKRYAAVCPICDGVPRELREHSER